MNSLQLGSKSTDRVEAVFANLALVNPMHLIARDEHVLQAGEFGMKSRARRSISANIPKSKVRSPPSLRDAGNQLGARSCFCRALRPIHPEREPRYAERDVSQRRKNGLRLAEDRADAGLGAARSSSVAELMAACTGRED